MSAIVPAPSAAPPLPRHALGLPAGSVRALLALAVLAMLWLLVWKDTGPGTKLPVSFIYLQLLMVLVLAHFFSAHGHTIGKHISTASPLGLPSGSVRLLLVLGYVTMIYYLYHHEREFEIPQKGNFFLMLVLMLSAFFVGHYLTIGVKMVSGGILPYGFQDFQAWIALLAMIALGGLIVIHTLINKTVSPEMQIGSLPLDIGLAALVGFYFGSRA